MSQQNCIDFLEEQRKFSKKWFRVSDVVAGLKDQGFSNGVLKGVGNDLMILASMGCIQCRGIGVWKHYKEFRAYEKLRVEKI